MWNLLQLAVSLCVLSISLPLSVSVSAPATISQDIELQQQHHWGNSEFNFTARYVTQSQGPRLLHTDSYRGPQSTIGEVRLSCNLSFGAL